MAFLHTRNVAVRGIAAAVPERMIDNLALPERISQEYSNADFCALTGVYRSHASETLTTSDLAVEAARRLMDGLGWEPETVDALLFVSQTPDYVLPATACILQDRLGLPRECYAEDISLGCSGWVYGLGTAASLAQNGDVRRVLLLAGDAKKRVLPAKKDPLFGHAATATALEWEAGAEGIQFHFGTDGSGYDAIITPDGGSRHPVQLSSFDDEVIDGRTYNRLTTRMKGMDVFSFGISTAPKSVKALAAHYGFDYQAADYYVFHQANQKMNDTIVRKLRLPRERVPLSMDRYGNTSSASIPLTIADRAREMSGRPLTLVCCGFGVGLSWGTCRFHTEGMLVPEVILVRSEE